MSDEMVSLNVDDLDVEELEHRLELAITAPHLLGWICHTHIEVGCAIHGCGCNADR